MFFIHRVPNINDRALALAYLREHYIPPVYSSPGRQYSISSPNDAENSTGGRQYSISSSNDAENNKSPNSAKPHISPKNRKDAKNLLRVMRQNGLFDETEAPEQLLEKSFADRLLELIDRENLRDQDVYRAAGVDRKLFSKIRSNRLYHPSKDTAIAFAVALRLPYEDADDLIKRAGYSLSHSDVRDVLIEFCLKARRFTLQEVNDLLYELGEEIIRK